MYPSEKKKPAVKRCDRRTAFYFSSQSGVSLLIIIFSIMILAVLGAAMYAITSTSYFNQASSQEAMKALYMAEAGPRIVASEYKAAAAANKNTELADLNGRTFTLTGGSGQFTINIYPYWLYAPGALNLPGPTAINNIVFNLPGGRPINYKESLDTDLVTFPTTGILKVGGVYRLWSYTNATAGVPTAAGTPITLNLSPNPALPSVYSIPSNTELYIGFVQNESGARIFNQQIVSTGGNLILNTTGNIAKFFPPENGNFTLYFQNGFKDYHYEQRDIGVINPGQTTLTNIQSVVCLGSVPCMPFTVISDGTSSLDPAINTQIYVGKITGIRSTGVN